MHKTKNNNHNHKTYMQTKTKWILGILFVAVVLTGVYFSDLSLQKGALVPKPDLAASLVRMEPTIPRAGQLVAFYFKVKNKSRFDSGESTAQLKVNDTITDNVSIIPLLRGQSTPEQALIWDDPTSAGSYNIQICADGTNLVSESNEGNNCTTGSVNVFEPLPPPPTADLEKWFLSRYRNDTNQIIVRLTIKNKGGSYSSPEQVKVRIYPTNINNTMYSAYVIERQIPIIAANTFINVATGVTNSYEESEITTSWTDAQLNGIQATKIKVDIDYDNALPETNETNNSAEVNIPPPLSLNQKPDLIVEGVGVSPVRLTVGNTAIISAVIKNQGNWQAGTSTVGMSADLAETVTPHAYLLINDASVQPYATLGNPPISPGQTRPASLPWTPSSSGSYSVKVCALNPPENNQLHVRAESNTDNNCITGATITVVAPVIQAPPPPTGGGESTEEPEGGTPTETGPVDTTAPPESTFQEQGMNALLLVPLFEKAPRVPVRQRTDRELSLQACVDKSTPEERSLCARTVDERY